MTSSPRRPPTSWAGSRSSDRTSHTNASSTTPPTSAHCSRTGSRLTHGFTKSSQTHQGREDSPSSAYYDRSSTDTFDSSLDSDDNESQDSNEDHHRIPPLPLYRKAVTGPTVQPSNYRIFPELFPSLDKMYIRHDEYTSDGNMNLRVDTQLPHRPHRHVQLFHLRMYDLDDRVFSLRRYCRESGREVCRTKREYTAAASDGGRQALQRSVSSVFRSLGARPQFRRMSSSSTLFSFKNGPVGKRPDSGLSMRSEILDSPDEPEQKSKSVPTNAIKLMFTNYATIEVVRKGGGPAPKRYDFSWWGRKYSWKRIYNANLGTTSFHLIRDSQPEAFLANVVAEARSPNELTSDEMDGGWMPPCTMWFSQEPDAALAEVFVSTGLISLVDDCIRNRWDPKRGSRFPTLRR
ncbi:hypothetical protein jhhlp_003459 [Lomentospora prolificans]|uniref:Uncharacterized protein n=1 Tax=Lomentospora prolificans TaxID=41688 RepID=A0A2N3N8T3_9PEZI|nr:hypothetical protein jhhlp_003459 [Lomentospora prolificans]